MSALPQRDTRFLLSSVCVGLRFWSGSDLLSRGVQWAESRLEGDHAPLPGLGLANHVGLELWTYDSAGLLWRAQGINAVPPRVCRYDARAASINPQTRLYVLAGADDPTHAQVIFRTAQERLGERYDYVGCAQAFLALLSHHPQTFLTNPRARLFCSEMVTVVLRRHGINVCPLTPACNVTPAGLEWWTSAQPFVYGPLARPTWRPRVPLGGAAQGARSAPVPALR
jgi:hypothetical protein